MVFLKHYKKYLSISLQTFVLIGVLSACSGDGSGGGITPPLLRDWEPNVFFNSAIYSNLCANPRTGTDPFSGGPVRDRQGRVVDENNWLRSIHNEFYLWYDEIIDADPGTGISTADYFDLQITLEPSETSSSRPKDIFHSAVNTQDLFDILVSGMDAGYGARFFTLSPTPPREVVVGYVEPNSPAEDQGLSRGVRILTVDGVDVVNGSDVNTINAGLFPQALNENHQFVIRELDASERTINMTSAEITKSPVQNVSVIPTASGNVGYFLFNDHIATAETQLIDAINELITMNVTDLVLDLRYNGGGFLDLASELAYMIAGEAPTDRKAFERLEFSDKYVNFTSNPLTGENLEKPFFSTVQGFSENLTVGDDLPTLNAQRVFVITSSETCSASEAIINGLRGVGVSVTQIGSTTCGKPYGSNPLGNCGTTYLFTQFQGFNELDQGEYSDGFKPENAVGDGVSIPGCHVADDFDHNFGDPLEANLSAALAFRQNDMCPPPPTTPTSTKPNQPSSQKISDGKAIENSAIYKPDALKMRIVVPR